MICVAFVIFYGTHLRLPFHTKSTMHVVSDEWAVVEARVDEQRPFSAGILVCRSE